jgi:hypothetical protein
MPPNPYATRAVPASEGGNAAFVALIDERGQPTRYAEIASDGVTIGRLKSSDLVLDDPTISRNHARVEWDGRRARVTDLGSKLGTFLGAVRLMPQTSYEWSPEQPLRIGRHVFRLYPGALPPGGRICAFRLSRRRVRSPRIDGRRFFRRGRCGADRSPAAA